MEFMYVSSTSRGMSGAIATLTFLMMASYLPHTVRGQQASDELNVMRTALAEGDAKRLVSMTDGSLELALFGASANYSGEQAELILKKFFRSNPPVSFEVLDFRESDRGIFVEGRLHTKMNTGSIRTYLRMKRGEGGWRLRELLLERSDR